MVSISFADLAQASEQLLRNGLEHPTPLTLLLVFAGGLLTSLGPCSLSILPVSLAYLAGFGEGVAWRRSAGFCIGVVSALVLLGSASALLGRLYGQTPEGLSIAVSILAVLMGLNLLGLLPLRLPLPLPLPLHAPAGWHMILNQHHLYQNILVTLIHTKNILIKKCWKKGHLKKFHLLKR